MLISSSNIPSVVSCPTSKSHAARALIIGALKSNPFLINDIPNAEDTQELIQVLERLGIVIQSNNNTIIVEDSFPKCEIHSEEKIDLGSIEGGTTFRFLLPFLCLGSRCYQLKLKGRLASRPMQEMYNLLKGLGASIITEDDHIQVRGPITLPQEIQIDCSKSTQFASAFELLKTSYHLRVSSLNLEGSRKYLELTRNMVSDLKDKTKVCTPPDFSSLSYFLAWSVLNQDIIIQNIAGRDSTQADDLFFDLLDKIGAQFSFKQNKLHIYKSGHLNPFDVDASACIDLVPTLIYLAAHIKGTSAIKNIKNLEHKESNRIEACLQLLDSFKVNYLYDEGRDLLEILGTGKSSGQAYIAAVNDHRMVMSAALFLKQTGGGELSHTESVNKSFPEFFTYFG